MIAEEFGVPVEEVERYHSMGIGYGILAQFYSIANGRCGATSSYTVDQLVAMKQSGMGMGEIRKQALGSASAKDCNLGRLKQGDLDAADASVAPGKDKDKPGKPDQSQKPTPAKPAAPVQPPKKPAPPKPNKPQKQNPPKKETKPAPPKKDNGNNGNKGGGGGKGK